MPGRSSNSANPNDDYKFTGHERDDEAGLTLDYMNARNYDPILGRFLQIDPLVDQFHAWNPYHYVYNNPLGFTDPTGMAPIGYGTNAEADYSGKTEMAGDCPRCDQKGDRRASELRNGSKTSDEVIAEEKAENIANAEGALLGVGMVTAGVSTSIGIAFEIGFAMSSTDEASPGGAATRAMTAEGVTQLVPKKFGVPGKIVGAIVGEMVGGAGDRMVSGEEIVSYDQIAIDFVAGFSGGFGANTVARNDATSTGMQRFMASGTKKLVKQASESGFTSSSISTLINTIKDWISGDE